MTEETRKIPKEILNISSEEWKILIKKYTEYKAAEEGVTEKEKIICDKEALKLADDIMKLVAKKTDSVKVALLAINYTLAAALTIIEKNVPENHFTEKFMEISCVFSDYILDLKETNKQTKGE